MELAVEDVGKIVTSYVPTLLGALAILIFGWLVARIIGAVVAAALRRTELDNRLARFIAGDRSAAAIHLEQWVGKAVFYLLMILVLVGFFQTLGLTLVTEPLNRLLNQFFQYAPQLFGAAALLLIAWVLASLLSAIISRVLRAVKVDQRLAEQTEYAQVSLAQTIADTAYWLVFLLFLPALLSTLSLQGLLGPVQGMINKILDFLPNILTAGLILLIGWFLARIVRGIVTNFLVAVGAERLTQTVGLNQILGAQSLAGLLGLISYVLILIPVVLAALDALQLQAVTLPTSNMLNKILAAIPDILAASLIFLFAFVIGRLAGNLTNNLLSGIGFNTILHRLGFSAGITSSGQRTPAEMIGYVVFLAIILVGATEASRQLGFSVLADLVNRFLLFAGDVVLGLIVFAIGLYLANLASAAIETSGAAHRGWLGLAARVSIIVLAGAMALRQMGVANDIINMAFGLLLGAVALAVALAVGLGARDVAGREVEEIIKSIRNKESNNGQGETILQS